MDDILAEIAAPRKKGGISNIHQLHYTAIVNQIIAKLTKSAAWFSGLWQVQL